jgi:RNA-binding protein 5/10
MSPQIHPSGFRISDRPVAASFAHPYSFQPAADLMLRDEACLASSVGLGGGEGTWVRYWDETTTIAMLEFEVEEPVAPVVPVKDKKEKRKAKGQNYAQVVVCSILTMLY